MTLKFYCRYVTILVLFKGSAEQFSSLGFERGLFMSWQHSFASTKPIIKGLGRLWFWYKCSHSSLSSVHFQRSLYLSKFKSCWVSTEDRLKFRRRWNANFTFQGVFEFFLVVLASVIFIIGHFEILHHDTVWVRKLTLFRHFCYSLSIKFGLDLFGCFLSYADHYGFLHRDFFSW